MSTMLKEKFQGMKAFAQHQMSSDNPRDGRKPLDVVVQYPSICDLWDSKKFNWSYGNKDTTKCWGIKSKK